MLSKEEKLFYSLTALKEVIETWDIDVELTLTKDGNKNTINVYEEIEKCVVECINNTQPYKFEDLKAYMFVFDKEFNGWGEIVRIIDTFVNEYGEKIVRCFATGSDDIQLRSYKENRFFSVQMANVIENKKSED